MEDIIMKPARRFNNVFDALYGMLDNDAWLTRSTGNSVPAVNISEDDKQYEIEFAVPGAKKEDFNIQIDEENQLVVSMEKTVEENKDKHYLRHEFSHTLFRQTFVLPEDIKRDEISARTENGVLYITLPKLTIEPTKPAVRTINID